VIDWSPGTRRSSILSTFGYAGSHWGILELPDAAVDDAEALVFVEVTAEVVVVWPALLVRFTYSKVST
jgi:hypothetical protein